MSSCIVKENINYIELLELVPNHMPLRSRPFLKALGAEEDVNQPSAATVDGAAVSFVSGVGGQIKDDILNSVLLAQLAANKVADRFSEIINWYKKYTEVLGKLGWAIQDFNFEDQGSSSVKLDVNAVVVGILGSIVTSNGIAIVNNVLQSLKEGSGDGSLTFNLNSSYKDNANFQIGHITQTDDGLVAMSNAAVEIHSSHHKSGWWLWSVDTSSAEIKAASQTMTFNTDLYDQVREIVRKKLGLATEDYIKDLDI